MPKGKKEEKGPGRGPKEEKAIKEEEKEKAGAEQDQADEGKEEKEGLEEGKKEEEPKDEGAGEEKEEKEDAKEGKKAPEEEAKEPEKPKEKKAPVTIIRMGGKDLEGNLPISRAILGIRGISYTFANAVSWKSGLGEKKLSELSDDEKKKVEDMITHPEKYGLPGWTFNRRFDPEDGTDRHVTSGTLELRHKMDINELKKRKCYRGVRHIAGLPVRGQRTRSSFRKAATVGVSRVKQQPGSKKESK